MNDLQNNLPNLALQHSHTQDTLILVVRNRVEALKNIQVFIANYVTYIYNVDELRFVGTFGKLD